MPRNFPTRPEGFDIVDQLRKGWTNIPGVLNRMGYDSLRPGQKDVVANIMAGRDTLCVLPTGSGKSACFVVPTLALDWKTIVFSPLVALMRDQVQSLHRMRVPAMAISSMQSDSENAHALDSWARGELSFLYVAPERLHNSRFNMAMDSRPPDMVVLDECFPKDVEILTDTGFRRFADLADTDLVAQVCPESRRTSFVRPTRIVKRSFDGDLVRFSTPRTCDISMTPNHNVLTVFDNGYSVTTAGEVRLGGNSFLTSAAHIVQGPDDLTHSLLDSLAIRAACPDTTDFDFSNCTVTLRNASIVAIRRLQDRFTRDNGGVGSVKSVKMTEGTKKYKRTLVIETDLNVLRLFRDMLSLDDMTPGMADSFLNVVSEYAEQGDHTEDFQRLSYATSIKENADFYQAAACLAGYTAKLFPTKKGKCFKVFVTKRRNYLTTNGMRKEYVPYKGTVYCVTVPTGFILVRSKGRTMVTGNCHTLSQWSENFRSSYCKVGDFISERKPQVVAAFTATCPEEVELDVRRVLGIDKARKLVYYPRRTNLILESRDLESEVQIADTLKREISGPAIVYCSTVARTEKTAATLGSLMGEEVTHFHGQLTDSDKRTNMDLFMSNRVRVVCATNAFGMGVDKPDVRGVVHRDIPGCIEALSQEVGRAGRDGKESLCVTFFNEDSVRTQKFFIECGNPSPTEIRQVFNLLKRSADRSGSLEMTGGDIANKSGVFKWKVSSIVEILKANGVIERNDNARKTFKIRKVVGSGLDAKLDTWMNMVEDMGVLTPEGFYEVDMEGFVACTGLTETTVRNWLKKWRDAEFVRYTPPFVGTPTKIIGDVNKIDFDRLEEKARSAHEKLNKVLDYVATPDKDKHDFLEAYFDHV